MHIIFVHGWSVTNTDTYGALPEWLAQQNQGFQIQNVCLGKYISFVDPITMDDIARAFDQALRDTVGAQNFSQGVACITHSTGGPVVRLWMKLYYECQLDQCPVKHLVMLAPANHGSALAQLGKGTLARMKFGLLEGVEPGVRVLDWLELGSDESWNLNMAWLSYDCVGAGIYPFVLTGQRIDRSFYDQLNSYTGEAGSDGVVRAAAANINYALLQLDQSADPGGLRVAADLRSPPTAFGILPGRSHSGNKIGILRSVTLANASEHPTPKYVLRCLQVASRSDYDNLSAELSALTVATQQAEKEETEQKLFGRKTYITDRYSMLVFRLIDDRGEVLSDYDLYITGGPNYAADDLPPGFFVDRQQNSRSPGKLTYFMDYDNLMAGLNDPNMEGRMGFKVVARPAEGPEALVYYRVLDFRSDRDTLSALLRPNESLMIEIKLKRLVDAKVARIENTLVPSDIDAKPLNHTVP